MKKLAWLAGLLGLVGATWMVNAGTDGDASFAVAGVHANTGAYPATEY